MKRVVKDGPDLEEVLQFGHGGDGVEAQLFAVDDGDLLRREVEQPPVQVVRVHARTEAADAQVAQRLRLALAGRQHLVERVVERHRVAVRALVLVPKYDANNFAFTTSTQIYSQNIVPNSN